MKTKRLYITASALLIILFASSCRQSLFLQRKYTPGIYLPSRSVAKASAKPETKNKTVPETALKTAYKEKFSAPKITAEQTINELALAGKKIMAGAKPIHKKLTIAVPDDCGDKIILKNGKIISGRVYEISEELIKYKLCNQPGGLYYHINVEDAYKITFANGTEEVFKYKKESSYTIIEEGADKPRSRSQNFALFGYFASAALLLIIGAAASAMVALTIGFLSLLLGVILLIVLKNARTNEAISALVGFGAFLGILWVILGAITVLALLFVGLLL